MYASFYLKGKELVDYKLQTFGERNDVIPVLLGKPKKIKNLP